MKNLTINSLGEVVLDGKVIREEDEAPILNTTEKAFMVAIHFKQAVNNARFRVYGITNDDGHQTTLVTEFVAFVDDKDAWEEIEEAAKKAGCEINVMRESEHIDKKKKAGDKEWTIGPNHGRMEKQVEVFCYVNDLKLDEIRERIIKIETITQEIWPKYGVDIL